jgi:hypothetical protein
LDLVLQLAMVGMSAGLGGYYISQTSWIPAAFVLVNATLLLYGIKQFIGFAELRQDLCLSIKDAMTNAVSNNLTARCHGWAASCFVSLRFTALQALRVLSPGNAVMSVLLALEVLSPALGGHRAIPPIQLESQRLYTRTYMLSEPALRHGIEGCVPMRS